MKNLLDNVRKTMVKAINDYHMLADNDQVMVGVSGGKDSTILLLLLEEIRRKSKISFSLHPVMLDQKQPGFHPHEFSAWLKNKGLDLEIIEENTYDIVTSKVAPTKSFCGLCSRLRRGILYNHAAQKNYSKIALGHHRDDINETALLNLFYSGTLASMPPKLQSDDKRNIIIRPLAYAAEEDLTTLEKALAIPVIPCNLCGNQEQLKRKKIKQLIKSLETENPRVSSSILAGLANVKQSQLLDRELHDFSRF